MYNSKLILLFNKLNGKDKRAINKFVRSPFFNHREEVTLLWDYLVKSKQGERLPLAKTEVFKILYREQAYDEPKMRHLMSWLLKNIEEYLAYAKFQERPIAQKLYLAEVYRGLNLEKHFNKTVSETSTLLESSVIDQHYYEFAYTLEFEKYAFTESQKRTKVNNLQELSQRLDIRILTAKLKQSCMLLAHQAVFKVEYDFSFLPALLVFIENNDAVLRIPGIAVYYYCYRALTEDNEIYFERFKQQLRLTEKLFAEDEIRSLYLLSINYCIQKLNKGDVQYVAEAFNLYKAGIESNILLSDGVISRFAYKNVVALGLTLKEYNWINSFIHQYQSKLELKYRKSNFSYNLARFYLSQNNYGKAMELLQNVDDTDLLLNLDSKVMLLKMYYELNENEALESLLNSFHVLLHRKKGIGYHKPHYQGVIYFTRKLLYLNPNDIPAKEKLKQDILSAEILPERAWLLEQLEKSG